MLRTFQYARGMGGSRGEESKEEAIDVYEVSRFCSAFKYKYGGKFLLEKDRFLNPKTAPSRRKQASYWVNVTRTPVLMNCTPDTVCPLELCFAIKR